MAKRNRYVFTCGHCNKKYRSETPLPDLSDGSVLVCDKCNEELSAAIRDLLGGAEKTPTQDNEEATRGE